MTTLETAKVSFFTITHCGFYAQRGKAPVFGGIDDTFRQLEAWGRDSELSLTKLFDPDPAADVLPVYLVGVKPIKDTWLLACWNEVPARDGAVASIRKDYKVGQAVEVHSNPISPNTIPGYATFFWVVPARGVVACISFDGQATMRKEMTMYVRRFLHLESKYVIEEATNDPDNTRIVGYTDKGDKVPRAVAPRFTLDTYTKKGRRDFVIANVGKIKRVIRRGHVTTTKTVDRRMYQAFVQFLRGDKARAGSVSGLHTVRVELDYTPTRAELIAMIDAEIAADDHFQFERLGFEIQGEADTFWIDRSMARGDLDLPVARVAGVVTVESLAAAIEPRASTMLQFLDDV